MRANQRNIIPSALISALLILALSGCGDSNPPTAPPTGTIEITVMTASTIGDVDTTGYVVSIDDGAWRSVGVPTRVEIDGLSKARHSITLSGLPTNCSVTSPNPLVVDLDPDLGTLLLTFMVKCPMEGPFPWDY